MLERDIVKKDLFVQAISINHGYILILLIIHLSWMSCLPAMCILF